MSARLLRIARDALAKRAGAAEQEGAEAGFTLIELMVVLLIMAILLAIAIPTFLGVKGGAQDRAAQSNLTNALTSAKAVYSSQGSYPVFTGAGGLQSTLATQEPELSFTTGQPAEGKNQIGTLVSADGQQLVLVGWSASGLCWALSDNDGTLAADDYGQAPTGTEYTAWNPAGGTACSTASITTAAINNTAPNLGWSSSYPTGTPGSAP